MNNSIKNGESESRGIRSYYIICALSKFKTLFLVSLLFFGYSIYSSSTARAEIKSMTGVVTKVEYGSHSGFITVKNEKNEISFFGNDDIKIKGKFQGIPSKGGKVIVYYQKTKSLDTPYIITTIVNLTDNPLYQQKKENVDLKIGKQYGGGIVFYIDKTGQHGLIVAEKDFSEELNWHDAVNVCNKLTLNGYSDWVLPDIKQLKELYLSECIYDQNSIDYPLYWSSSTNKGNLALCKFFGSGGIFIVNKMERHKVRAIRAF